MAQELCPVCQGSARGSGDYTACYRCNGTGYIEVADSGSSSSPKSGGSIYDDPNYGSSSSSSSSGSSGGSQGDTPDVLVLQGHKCHRMAMAAMKEYDKGNDEKWSEYLNYCRQAIPFYTKAINYPGCGKVYKLEAYVKRGFCNRATKNTDQAIEDCTNAIKIDSNVPEAYMDRALAYIDKGIALHKDDAIADFKQAADLGFDAAMDALKQLGEYYTPTPRTPSTQAAPKAQKTSSSGGSSSPKKGGFLGLFGKK